MHKLLERVLTNATTANPISRWTVIMGATGWLVAGTVLMVSVLDAHAPSVPMLVKIGTGLTVGMIMSGVTLYGNFGRES